VNVLTAKIIISIRPHITLAPTFIIIIVTVPMLTAWSV
jgi:hypothetical protein